MKRALIYSPYLDTLGGGERYTFALIKAFLREDWIVDLSWDDQEIINKCNDKFGINLTGVNLVGTHWIVEKQLNKWNWLKKYDLLFWVSDGSIPLVLGAKKQWLHFQVPFINVNGRSITNQTKLKMFSNIICNSYFTSERIDSEFGVKSKVIYPPVGIDNFKQSTKTNTILYVGRFSRLLQDKAHAELIETFKSFVKVNSNGYKLILAGSTESVELEYLNWLKNNCIGYDIEIITDPSFAQLKQLYSEAKFFWSLAGINANEEEEPEKCEHFGITIVEAMAAGCIPILLNKGGHREIVEDGQSGYLVNRVDQMINITNTLANQINLISIIQKTIARANIFSENNFERQVINLLNY